MIAARNLEAEAGRVGSHGGGRQVVEVDVGQDHVGDQIAAARRHLDHDRIAEAAVEHVPVVGRGLGDVARHLVAVGQPLGREADRFQLVGARPTLAGDFDQVVARRGQHEVCGRAAIVLLHAGAHQRQVGRQEAYQRPQVGLLGSQQGHDHVPRVAGDQVVVGGIPAQLAVDGHVLVDRLVIHAQGGRCGGGSQDRVRLAERQRIGAGAGAAGLAVTAGRNPVQTVRGQGEVLDARIQVAVGDVVVGDQQAAIARLQGEVRIEVAVEGSHFDRHHVPRTAIEFIEDLGLLVGDRALDGRPVADAQRGLAQWRCPDLPDSDGSQPQAQPQRQQPNP